MCAPQANLGRISVLQPESWRCVSERENECVWRTNAIDKSAPSESRLNQRPGQSAAGGLGRGYFADDGGAVARRHDPEHQLGPGS